MTQLVQLQLWKTLPACICSVESLSLLPGRAGTSTQNVHWSKLSTGSLSFTKRLLYFYFWSYESLLELFHKLTLDSVWRIKRLSVSDTFSHWEIICLVRTNDACRKYWNTLVFMVFWRREVWHNTKGWSSFLCFCCCAEQQKRNTYSPALNFVDNREGAWKKRPFFSIYYYYYSSLFSSTNSS